jgi:hypothetical protein
MLNQLLRDAAPAEGGTNPPANPSQQPPPPAPAPPPAAKTVMEGTETEETVKLRKKLKDAETRQSELEAETARLRAAQTPSPSVPGKEEAWTFLEGQ